MIFQILNFVLKKDSWKQYFWHEISVVTMPRGQARGPCHHFTWMRHCCGQATKTS